MRRRTGPDRATVELVRWRDRDRCRRCGAAGEQIHHRRPRGAGGTKDPAINATGNLVLVCQECHLWIETHRTDAMAQGWLVSRYGPGPASIPITVRGLPLWLDDHGKTHPEISKETTHA